MTTVLERLKVELTEEINLLMSEVQVFVSTNKLKNARAGSVAQYLQYNQHQLSNVEAELTNIRTEFNPQANEFESFQNTKDRLRELQREISRIQARAESKLSNLAYLPLVKVLTSIVVVGGYVWLWVIFWGWVHGLWHVLWLPMVLSVPLFIVLLVDVNFEGGSSFASFTRFLTELCLAENRKQGAFKTLWFMLGSFAIGIPMLFAYFIYQNSVWEATKADVLSGDAYIRIDPGEFMMGCSANDKECDAYENPVHRVRITTAYEVAKYEVTQMQWEAVMGSNPSHFTGALLPVEQVSWHDAQQFVSRLNARNDGYVYRLPTEAEWEYAARAGTSGTYDSNPNSVAWYGDNSGNETHPVGQKQPNALGLFDMVGNVEEWCQDWIGNYPGASVTNPTGPTSGSYRVFRGGGWRGPASASRPWSRNGGYESYRDVFLGFRVVRQQKSISPEANQNKVKARSK